MTEPAWHTMKATNCERQDPHSANDEHSTPDT